MKITDILASKPVTVSFEVFPPKEWEKVEHSREIAAEIAAFSPDFMSVTYGAGGGTSDYTVAIADEIQNKCGVTCTAHLTCVSSTYDKVKEVLRELKAHKIENILALRGDIPENPDFVLPKDFSHASDLVELIKQEGDFCIGGACYPEGHPESPSMEKDIDFLAYKVDKGVDYFVSQMFFDNNIFYAFRYRMLKRGITVPVIAGIMPVTNSAQVKRICQLSGTMLPPRFKAVVDRFGDDNATMRQAGIAYATEQIIDLIANGVNNIHIYTMNQPRTAEAILSNISELIK